jgi:hypothetical protein
LPVLDRLNKNFFSIRFDRPIKAVASTRRSRAIPTQAKRKGRRALRRRPFLATAGSRVRFRCDSRHCTPEQTKSGLLCT